MKAMVVSAREACEILRVSRSKLYEMIKAEVVSGFKVGADWRVRVDSIERCVGTLPDDFLKELAK